MPRDERNLLDILKFELRFLQKGGYGRLPRAPWRAPLIFEDSLICMNYDVPGGRASCSECLLMQFVPPERQAERIPCRHIPLDAAGQTLKMLYAWGTQQEIEEALETWLKTTIHRLEQGRLKAELPHNVQCSRDRDDFGHLQNSFTSVEGTMIAKCANPACRTGFDHLIGGRFFRFRLTEAEVPIIPGATQNAHHVIHYWLCPACSKMFSLIHVEVGKIVLRLLEQESEAAPPQDHLTAA